MLTSCILDTGHNSSQISRKLNEYAIELFDNNVFDPAVRLAAYLFHEEYKVADDAGKAALKQAYNIEGDVKLNGNGDIIIDDFWVLKSSEKAFAEQWKPQAGGSAWRYRDKMLLTPVRNEMGIITEIKVETLGYTDTDEDVTAFLLIPSGAFTLSNPLMLGRDIWTMNHPVNYPSGDIYNIRYDGELRVEIRANADGRIVDWIDAKATDDHKTLQITLSRSM